MANLTCLSLFHSFFVAYSDFWHFLIYSLCFIIFKNHNRQTKFYGLDIVLVFATFVSQVTKDGGESSISIFRCSLSFFSVSISHDSLNGRIINMKIQSLFFFFLKRSGRAAQNHLPWSFVLLKQLGPTLPVKQVTQNTCY